MSFRFLPVAILLAACRGKTVDTSETGSDTDITDTDIDTDTDTDIDSDTDADSDTSGTGAEAPSGFAFCGAGGRVFAGNTEATLCLGPADAAVGEVSAGGMTWQAGPIYILDPQ